MPHSAEFRNPFLQPRDEYADGKPAGSSKQLVGYTAMMGQAPTPGSAPTRAPMALDLRPLTTVSQTRETRPDSGVRSGHLVDPDLRIRIRGHWLDPLL